MSDSYGYEVCSHKQSNDRTIVIIEGDRDGASKVVSQMEGRKVGNRVRIVRPDIWTDDTDNNQTKTAVEAGQ